MREASVGTAALQMDGYEARVTFRTMKRLRVRIKPPDGTVAVSAPHGTPVNAIRRFLTEHQEWILRNQSAVRLRAPLGLTLETGGRIQLWGVWREVVVTDASRASARTVGTMVEVRRPAGDDSAVQRAVEALYRRELGPAAQGMLERWEPRVGRASQSVGLRRMTSRWGSCNTITGAITLNTALARFPPAALEFVVVHELVHLLERGHGAVFQHHMDRLLPDWKARRQLLRQGP